MADTRLAEAREELGRRVALMSFRTFLPLWHFVDRETGQVRRFSELWPGQEAFLGVMLEHPWLLALKAGKLGFTELECAWDGFKALTAANARVHLFSRDFEAAKELLGYVRFGLQRLPEAIRPKILSDERGGDTERSLRFRMGPDDVRTISTYAAGPNVSIEQSCIHAHVDEIARMPFAEATWNAVASTIAPGGTCHVLSRGAGEDNYLKELWDAAEEGASQLHPFFQDWRQRPGRDPAWYETQAGNLTAAGLNFYAPDSPDDALAGEDTAPFIHIELWDACEDKTLPQFLPNEVALEANRDAGRARPLLIGKIPVVISVDAASTGDCFAVVAVTRHPQRPDDVIIQAARRWTPPKGGGEIDYAEPECFIRSLILGGCRLGHSQEPQFAHVREGCPACQEKNLIPPYNVVEITYDQFQLTDMMQRINRDLSIWTISFDQGALRLQADRQLYDLIVQKRLSHPGLPEVREHLLNARAKLQKGEDSKLRIVKKSPSKKIDLAVAASMGTYECLQLLL